MHGWVLMLNGRAEDGLREVNAGLELERSLGHSEGEAVALWRRGEVLTALGRHDEGERDILSGLTLSAALGNREWISIGQRALAFCRQGAGDLDGAEAALREAMEAALGLPVQQRFNAAHLASVLLERGDVEAAERYAEEGRGGIEYAGLESQLVLAAVALTRGDPDGPSLAIEALSATEAAGYLCSHMRKRIAASSDLNGRSDRSFFR